MQIYVAFISHPDAINNSLHTFLGNIVLLEHEELLL